MKKVAVKSNRGTVVWEGYLDHFCDRENLNFEEVEKSLNEKGGYPIGPFMVLEK